MAAKTRITPAMPFHPRGKDRPAEAKPFVIRYVAGIGWQVKQGENWRRGLISINGMLLLPSENGELRGLGVLERGRDGIRITA